MNKVNFVECDCVEAWAEQGIRLTVKGHGRKTALFQAGALWRLDELGLLEEVREVRGCSRNPLFCCLRKQQVLIWRADKEADSASFPVNRFENAVVQQIRANTLERLRSRLPKRLFGAETSPSAAEEVVIIERSRPFHSAANSGDDSGNEKNHTAQLDCAANLEQALHRQQAYPWDALRARLCGLLKQNKPITEPTEEDYLIDWGYAVCALKIGRPEEPPVDATPNRLFYLNVKSQYVAEPREKLLLSAPAPAKPEEIPVVAKATSAA